MVREDRVMMSMKELKRLHVIRQVMEQRITQVKAGTLVGLADRHVRRLLQRVKQEGDKGLTHRGAGLSGGMADPIENWCAQLESNQRPSA